MQHPVSIAIETSCRAGGVALGMGKDLVNSIKFDATGRHATQLIRHLEGLVSGAELTPDDIEEVYVSAGPGSFTGLRVGITAVRTLAQAVKNLRCLPVPTARVIAAATVDLPWEHLAVLLDARQGSAHVTFFSRSEDQLIQTTPGRPMTAEEFLRDAPKPVMLVGEAMEHIDLKGPGIETAPENRLDVHMPDVDNVWRVGRELASGENFVHYNDLLPTYARKPEAVRLWDLRTGAK